MTSKLKLVTGLIITSCLVTTPFPAQTANYAINPTAEQALRPNQTVVPQRVIAALAFTWKPTEFGMRLTARVLAVATMFWVGVGESADLSPYSGQQHREIKALSEVEIEGLLKGKGLGYAKAAELNGYPGPSHVLELAEELKLSESQKAETEGLLQSMETEARVWGKKLVESEKELDELFKQNLIDENKLKDSLNIIADYTAKVREAHLSAHLKQKLLLTKDQLDLYVRIRGYENENHEHKGHNHGG